MTDPIRILLADDHPTLRVGLRISLQQAPDIVVVAEAGTGAEALAQSAALLPDVALLDCVLPELAGPAVAAEIRRRGLPVRVLALSGHDDAHFLAAMHDAGAAGYLLKDAPPASILVGVAPDSGGWRSYNRNAAVNYADAWAYGRNPAYYDFSNYYSVNKVIGCRHLPTILRQARFAAKVPGTDAQILCLCCIKPLCLLMRDTRRMKYCGKYG